ncbi:hypothetical protein JCM15765_02290 [Paradesulfitobacterium aromaticivorans]
MGDWERGRSLPSITALIAIVKQFNVSADWVLFGDDANRKNDNLVSDEYLARSKENLSENDKKLLEDFIDFLMYRRVKEEAATYEALPQELLMVADEQATYTDENYIPLLGTSAAGKPILINEVLEGYVPVGKKISGQKAFAVRAKGDSMEEAGIDDGDIVVIKHQPIVDRGEIALFRINEETTIKYFSPKGKEIQLLPANSIYRPINVSPKDTFAIIGKVVQVIKKEEAEEKLRHFYEE